MPKFPAGESLRIRRVIIGTLPCVSITSLNQDANMATNANSDTMMLAAQQNVKERWFERISCFVEGLCSICFCI